MSAEPTGAQLESEATDRLLRLLGGKWIAAALSAAASLGVVDALAAERLTLPQLARRLDCDPNALARLMRVLEGEALASCEADGTYTLSETGRLLARDSLGRLASFVGAPFGWDPWSSLPAAVRKGESAFSQHYGRSLFDHLDRNPEDAALYHEAIEAFSRPEARALAEVYDFSQAKRIADIGGGGGSLLIEVLSRWPELSGVLLERPAAAGRARAAFERAGLTSRCEARVGDFFVALPEDVDVCILMHILHSWDDDAAIDLLRRCGATVGADGRVLIVEGLRLPGGRRSLTNLLDLEMLVLCGNGHERSKPEMRRLIAAAGLRLLETRPLAGGIRLLVCSPRARERSTS